MTTVKGHREGRLPRRSSLKSHDGDRGVISQGRRRLRTSVGSCIDSSRLSHPRGPANQSRCARLWTNDPHDLVALSFEIYQRVPCQFHSLICHYTKTAVVTTMGPPSPAPCRQYP